MGAAVDHYPCEPSVQHVSITLLQNFHPVDQDNLFSDYRLALPFTRVTPPSVVPGEDTSLINYFPAQKSC